MDSNVVIIYTPYITKNGKRVYRKDGKVYRLEIPADKYDPNRRSA